MTTRAKHKSNICVEIPLPDGCLSMYIGRQVSRTIGKIILDDASWIASTGRRHLFFAGTPDSSCEIEPYPAGVRIELPGSGAIVTDWPRDLPRSVR